MRRPARWKTRGATPGLAGDFYSYQETSGITVMTIYNGSTHADNYIRFPAGKTGTPNQWKLYLGKSGSPTGNATPQILDDSGNVLFSATAIDVATLAGTVETTLTFTGVPMLAGTFYRLKVVYTGGDASNYLAVGVKNTNIPANYTNEDPNADDALTHIMVGNLSRV